MESCDFEVSVVGDGLSAVSFFAQTPVEIVLVDVGLPDINGYEVAKRLRATGAKAFLVALTGHAQPKDKAEALAAGFNEHLAKPFDIEELEALINAHRP